MKTQLNDLLIYYRRIRPYSLDCVWWTGCSIHKKNAQATQHQISQLLFFILFDTSSKLLMRNRFSSQLFYISFTKECQIWTGSLETIFIIRNSRICSIVSGIDESNNFLCQSFTEINFKWIFDPSTLQDNHGTECCVSFFCTINCLIVIRVRSAYAHCNKLKYKHSSPAGNTEMFFY